MKNTQLISRTGYFYQGTRYSDVFKIDENQAKSVVRHGGGAWKVGKMFFNGEAASIKLLALVMGEQLVHVM